MISLSIFLERFIAWYASLALVEQVLLGVALLVLLLPSLIALVMLMFHAGLRLIRLCKNRHSDKRRS
jgi:hypothetical protein